MTWVFSFCIVTEELDTIESSAQRATSIMIARALVMMIKQGCHGQTVTAPP